MTAPISTINDPLPASSSATKLLTPCRPPYGWTAEMERWFEVGVTVDGGNFIWAKIQNPEFRLQNPELESVLPADYTIGPAPPPKTGGARRRENYAWWQAGRH